jgi:NADPH:quinone reductase-like Zn-dependent oxidoreductase
MPSLKVSSQSTGEKVTYQCYITDGKGFQGLRLEERHPPKQLEKNDVLVDVQAVSLNYRDLMVLEGSYGDTSSAPIIVASDMAGKVSAVGSHVKEFSVGDRVLNSPIRTWPGGMLRSEWSRTVLGGAGVDGVLTEKFCYPSESLVKVPSDLTFEEAATLPIAGLTAWAAVVTHGRAKPGDWILLHGTGGVSIFAAQIAKTLGARVIMTTSNKGKGQKVSDEFGVDEILDYRDENWPKQVKKITSGHGCDIVVDTAGGPTFARSIKACAYGARIGVIGILDGTENCFNAYDLMPKQITVRGIFMESTEVLRTFCQAMETGKIRPYIDKIFPFAQAPEAYKYLESQQHIGKVVINLQSE